MPQWNCIRNFFKIIINDHEIETYKILYGIFYSGNDNI